MRRGKGEEREKRGGGGREWGGKGERGEIVQFEKFLKICLGIFCVGMCKSLGTDYMRLKASCFSCFDVITFI